MRRVLISLLICSFFFACEQSDKGTNKEFLPPSSGKFGEVLVVVDTLYENRQTGKILEEIFFKSLVGVPQRETQFRMSTVPPRSFKSILKRSRNILKLSIRKNKRQP